MWGTDEPLKGTLALKGGEEVRAKTTHFIKNIDV